MPDEKTLAALIGAARAVLELHIAHHNQPEHAALRAAILKAEEAK